VSYRDDRDALIEQTKGLRRELQMSVATAGVLAAEREALKVEVESLRRQVQSLSVASKVDDKARSQVIEVSAERDGLRAEVETLRRGMRSAAQQRGDEEEVRRDARTQAARSNQLATALAIERARPHHSLGLYAVATLVGAAVASFGWMVAGL
jgi:hypothetical protein